MENTYIAPITKTIRGQISMTDVFQVEVEVPLNATEQEINNALLQRSEQELGWGSDVFSIDSYEIINREP